MTDLIIAILLILAMFTISYVGAVSRYEDKKIWDRYISGKEEERE